jgi:hypothetical protein
MSRHFRGSDFFLYPRVQASLNFLSNGYRGSFPGVKRQDRKRTTFRLMLMTRKRYVFMSWCLTLSSMKIFKNSISPSQSTQCIYVHHIGQSVNAVYSGNQTKYPDTVGKLQSFLMLKHVIRIAVTAH